MPLLDHFHPPLSLERHWGSFHARWLAALSDSLNIGGLPEGYFAEMQVALAGGRIEVDVAAEKTRSNGLSPPGGSSGGGVATKALPSYAPPAPATEWEAHFPDDLEVLVLGTEGGPTLAGAIELVSPRNKDRPEARRAFAVKCLAYLQQGVGVVVVDVVTSRLANLHAEIASLLPPGAAPAVAPPLYATAYRPFRRGDEDRIAGWLETLTLGEALPTLPLWLRGAGAVPVNLDAAYSDARRASGL
jgi:hypothetical protein